MKRDEVRKVAREAFDRLVKDVEAGKSDTLKAYLKVTGRFQRYSVGNAILIQLQKPNATHGDHGAGCVPSESRFLNSRELREILEYVWRGWRRSSHREASSWNEARTSGWLRVFLLAAPSC